MAQTFTQRNLSGGEISPTLYGRADTVKYQAGLKTCRNMVVREDGTLENRGGYAFVTEVKDSSKATRVIRFRFNDAQTYVIELGEGYMRFIQDQGQVIVSGVAAWVTTTAYVVGDLVVQGGVNYYCQTAHTSGTFATDLANGNWYALTNDIYEIPTPYLESELFGIQYIQSGDVITLVHENHTPRELKRTGNTEWTLTQFDFLGRVAQVPQFIAYASGGGASTGTHQYRWAMTTVLRDGRETLWGFQGGYNITNITQANPAVFTTSASHGYNDGDIIFITSVDGMTEINERYYIVVNTTATTGELLDMDRTNVDSTGYGAYSANGVVARCHTGPIGIARHTAAQTPVILTYSLPVEEDAVEVRVYRSTNDGSWGYVGSCDPTIGEFHDETEFPDYDQAPPQLEVTPFIDSNPTTVAYVQQRLGFAGTPADPQRVRLSQIGNFNSFYLRQPPLSDDAIDFNVASNELNRVKHLVELDSLLLMTEGGVFIVEGGADGVITPTSLNLRKFGYDGSGSLRPIPIRKTVIYVTDRGRDVIELQYNEASGLTPRDLSIYARHLFTNYTISDWTHATEPHSTIWAVRSDGTLLGLTYVPEHKIDAWHRHDTVNGTFESVTSIPEGAEDGVYVVVNRTINGATKRYIERLTAREAYTDVRDFVGVDSSLSLDNRNTTATTMTVTTSTTYDVDEVLTITASAGYFVAGDVGNRIDFEDASGNILARLTITGYTSATAVSATADRDLPAALQATATTTWGKAVDAISGLDHLEGETVYVVADGYDGGTYTVASGAITLDTPAVVIHVGLAVTSEIESLPVEILEGTFMDRKMLASRAWVLVEGSRHLTAGADDGTLYEWQNPAEDDEDAPIVPYSGVMEIDISDGWENRPTVKFQTTKGLPLRILAIGVTVTTGGR